ncbi:uncharacterized protein LOC124342029 [Daphnia pulicaria]|uniref:uncharacterized protein LOC124342029 n=1 Tax=Daphnia pulicaria TaxID=35523 RepID=UPI001EEBC3CC|nr:uncharacterized protein LOC124342029 [Daphnia pulicaria]
MYIHSMFMLQDSTINAYRPGHIILIAMSQPANFCVCHRDLETFIRELFERGIPQEALFIYCYGLDTSTAKTLSYETIVLAADLRNAILANLPRYGIRPAISGYLYACNKAENQRFNTPERGRYTYEEKDTTTTSQCLIQNNMNLASSQLRCQFPNCKQKI